MFFSGNKCYTVTSWCWTADNKASEILYSPSRSDWQSERLGLGVRTARTITAHGGDASVAPTRTTVCSGHLQGAQGFNVLKKSLPLSSTRMKAGKSSTSIFQMASMPSSGYSTHSIDLMLDCERTAATPPMLPR